MKPTNEIRPIDANSLIATLNDNIETLRAFYVALYCTASTLEVVKKDVESTPTLDVAPVKHARWELERDEYGQAQCYHCSECDRDWHHTGVYSATNYCPNCGAKMDDPPTDW